MTFIDINNGPTCSVLVGIDLWPISRSQISCGWLCTHYFSDILFILFICQPIPLIYPSSISFNRVFCSKQSPISKLVPCSKRCWCSVWWLCPLTNTIIGDYHGPLGQIKTMQTPGYKLKNMFLYHVFGLSLQRLLCNYHL